jgi:hypothetical protein
MNFPRFDFPKVLIFDNVGIVTDYTMMTVPGMVIVASKMDSSHHCASLYWEVHSLEPSRYRGELGNPSTSVPPSSPFSSSGY